MSEEVERVLPERHQERQIRSFVMRAGRMTDSQRKAYERLLPIYGLTLEKGVKGLEGAFDNEGDVVFEIGFG
ncbi:MAG: tRNA (guanosine(46)-N7)-methyltransferase TrmB, partial [Sinobacterium sp.]|nr:tRNA (guanosine(46)-N7)-methyltransferase TrmB [Sinobacterium sp.]